MDVAEEGGEREGSNGYLHQMIVCVFFLLIELLVKAHFQQKENKKKYLFNSYSDRVGIAISTGEGEWLIPQQNNKVGKKTKAFYFL